MSDEEPEEQAPRPARKVKKKRRDAPAPDPSAARSEDEGERAAAADADTPRGERPAFAARFPDDPALNDLLSAFEQGNYARVRRETPALAKRTARADVRRAARELARRLEPDPLAVYLLIAAALLLMFLAAWYWSHPHEAPL